MGGLVLQQYQGCHLPPGDVLRSPRNVRDAVAAAGEVWAVRKLRVGGGLRVGRGLRVGGLRAAGGSPAAGGSQENCGQMTRGG